MAIFDNALTYAKMVVDQEIKAEDICLDMTLGNGNDTIYLAHKCKHVFAFDINPAAITSAQKNIDEANIHNVSFILDSHQEVSKYINGSIGVAMFNLGYLPGGNKTIHTNYPHTIQAIKNILPMLRASGVIVIVLYPGSSRGYEESLYVEDYVTTLSQKFYDVVKYQSINQIHYPPYVIAIRKKMR